jgi:hypothetical protein
MHRKHPSLVASIGWAALILGPAAGWAQPSLGVAQSFAVLGGTTVTNTGSTTIFGDLGVAVSFTSISTLSGPAMAMLAVLLAFAGLAAARRKAMI